MKISWLHISDLHIFSPKSKGAGEQYDQDTVLNRFLKYVQNELPHSVQKPQFIFVTGDLAFGGKNTDYFGPSPSGSNGRPVIEFLRELAQHLDIHNDRVFQSVFTVPGNHDIDREKLAIRSIESGCLKMIEDPKEVTSFLLDASHARSAVFNRLQNYVDFWKQLRGKDAPIEECLWYAERPKLDDETDPLAIVGLCSAWMSGSCWKVLLETTPGHENDEEDPAYLALCEKKVADLLGKAAGADITVALMHHDYQILNQNDRQRCGPLLEQQCEFILCGHRHKPDLMPRRIGAKTHIVQAGASYDSRDLRNAFNMVEVNLDTRHARMIVVEYHKDQWQVDRTAFKLNDQDKAIGYELSDDGVLSFPLNLIEYPDGDSQGSRSSEASLQAPNTTTGRGDSDYISTEREDPKGAYRVSVSGWGPFGPKLVEEDTTLQGAFREPQVLEPGGVKDTSVFYSQSMQQAIGDMVAIQPDFFSKREFKREKFVLMITQKPLANYSGLITRETTIRKDVGLGHDAVIARFDTMRTLCEIVPFDQLDSTSHHGSEKLSLSPIRSVNEVEQFYVDLEVVKPHLDEGRIGRDRSFVIFDVHGSGKTSLLANLCVDAIKHGFQPLWVILPDGPVTTDLAKELADYTRSAAPTKPILVIDAVERCPSVLENIIKMKSRVWAELPVWISVATEDLSSASEQFDCLEKLLGFDCLPLPGVLSENDIAAFVERIRQDTPSDICDFVTEWAQGCTPGILVNAYDVIVTSKGLPEQEVKRRITSIAHESGQRYEDLFNVGLNEHMRELLIYVAILGDADMELLEAVIRQIGLEKDLLGVLCSVKRRLFTRKVPSEFQSEPLTVAYMHDGLRKIALAPGNFDERRAAAIGATLASISEDLTVGGKAALGLLTLYQHYGEKYKSLAALAKNAFADVLSQPHSDARKYWVAACLLEDLPELIGMWERAIADRKPEPVWSKILDSFGRELGNQKEMHQEAKRLFHKALQADPDNAGARTHLAQAHYFLKDFHAAISVLEEGPTTQRQDYNYHYLKGQLHLEIGKEDEAREAWEQALAQDPDNSKVLANLAVLDSRKDDYPQAKAMLVRAFKADPTDEQVLNRLVEVELKLQGVAELPTSSPERDDVLLAVYKSLRNKFPDNWFLLAGSSVALSRLSRFAEKAGHQFEARRHFREASEILKRLLQERPKDLKAYGYVLGETYRMSAGASFRKTLGAVVGGIRRVVNRDDTRPRDLYNLACAFALAGDRGGMLWALRVTINFEEKYRKEAREDDDFRWFWNDYDFQALTSP